MVDTQRASRHVFVRQRRGPAHRDRPQGRDPRRAHPTRTRDQVSEQRSAPRPSPQTRKHHRILKLKVPPQSPDTKPCPPCPHTCTLADEAPSGRIGHMFESRDAPVQGTPTPGCDSARLPASAPSRDSALLRRIGTLDGSGASEAELIDQIRAIEGLRPGWPQRRLASPARSPSSASGPNRRRSPPLPIRVPDSVRSRARPPRVPDPGSPTPRLCRRDDRDAAHDVGTQPRPDLEWSATVLVKETAILSREHRTAVDAELAHRLGELGPRQLGNQARKIGYRLDPGSALRRVRGANADRHVSLRPAPDTMAWLTGLLPVADGVACKVALDLAADAAKAQGDERSRGQIMADTLIGRITGREDRDPTGPRPARDDRQDIARCRRRPRTGPLDGPWPTPGGAGARSGPRRRPSVGTPTLHVPEQRRAGGHGFPVEALRRPAP